MIRTRLRYKILLGALLLVFTVSVAITAVVSVLVTRQNKQAVHLSLDNALTVIRDSIAEHQASFAAAIQHMAAANKLGDDVKFLGEFADSDLSLTGNSYANIGKAITNAGLVDGLFSVRVYGQDGNLVCFFEKAEDQNRIMGFLHQGTFHSRRFKEGDDYEQIKLTQAPSMAGVSPQFDAPIPTAAGGGFSVAGGHVSLETLVPVYANVYNRETEQTEPKQFGFVRAVEQLEAGFVAQMGRITGMKMNLFVGDRFSAGNFSTYETVDLTQVPERADGAWDLKNQSFFFSDVGLDGSRYFQGLLPIYAGQNRVGGLLILQSDAVVKANTRQMMTMISLVALVCVILVIPLAWLAAARVVNPLVVIVDKLKDIAEGEGDLTTRLEVTSKDEIGQVAGWFNSFIDKIHELIREVAENANRLNRSSSTLEALSRTMADGASKTSERANSVSAASEEMSTSMNTVAGAMEQASGNMATVSGATGEMTQTITEISKNTVDAREITQEVVEKTRTASEQIGELGGAADEIGQVVDVITDISSQVNLLALNATIEAARAGEAGKGFAVVANEIKDLAGQTAGASNQIKEKVANIRASTGRTVEQIDDVSQVVNKVNEIVLIIASAVEEQSATTQSMAENIGQVSEGIEDVNTNISQSSAVSAEIARDISGVTQAATEMTQNSGTVDVRSKELSDLAEKLMTLVKKFKI